MASTHGHAAEAAHAGVHGDPNSPFHIHHPNVRTYLVTYVALVILLIVTVVIYYFDAQLYVHIPGINLILAMIVGITKAYLVIRNFMNVKGSTKLTFLWAVLGFIWLLLMAGIFVDYQTRSWVDQSGWQLVPAR
jgi:caa(3)-type oxidase subunit IV